MRLHSFLYGAAIELEPPPQESGIAPIPVEAVSLQAHADGYELTISI
jgi:hypothetical protein